MVGVGNIVSVGGAGGSGGGGGSSGIQNLNGQTGPVVTLVGTRGIVIAPVAPNIINIGYDASGVVGVNGIDVQQVGGNFVVDGASLSGASSVSKFAASFTDITSGVFTHSFNTLDVIVQVFDVRRHVILPDAIIVENGDQVSVRFNRPQSGRVVII